VRARARRLQSRSSVPEQRNTKPICTADLGPLLATVSGVERATRPMPAVELDSLLYEMCARPRSWPFAIQPARLFVIAVSFALTLLIGIGLLVHSGQ